MSATESFIDGAAVPSAEVYENIDPSTSRSLGTVARGGPDEVDRAVGAARRAQRQWRTTTPEHRSAVLERIATAIDTHHAELARYECEDTGKPASQARADVTVAARYFRFYAHAIDTYYGQIIPLSSDLHIYTRREPLGVTGHIVAWNYPIQLVARAVAPAIAAGNGVVAKPADETPRTAVALARIAVDSGLPDGVFNVVTGFGAEAGAALTAHPGVDSLGFVGSTRIGSEVAAAAAQRVIPAVLELGGKSPQIVFADADLDTAAEFVAKAILQNAGQTCSAGSRLLVQESVHDALVDKVLQRFAGVTMGPGCDDPGLGPLISRKQQTRVAGMVNGLTRGEILCGGAVPTGNELTEGCYFPPTLIDGVDPAAAIAQEEIFGPVLTVNTFADDDQALALANGTEYALLAALWTRDLSRAHRLAAEIVAGQVYVNTYGAGGGVELPFGGFRRSGYGREKGVAALDAVTATKTVVVKL
ncbi:aldehyde dehydrogenase family protein [Nocardia flavorosea]|uniref:Aldehyde dehydrogenase family protein n=1 Tax=Nocardia flavorosea TaxID=53429 RepID=A0A846YNS2_9NOCA|nr:aldehyde dehydrogenase family protein [Nocardia flavorosea]NKY59092.1 aldehyde dehydrogenase family protein [Nocardia flavorosea]